jgi:hypothetical protein
MAIFPFEVSLDEIFQDPEKYVDAVFSCLESEFLVMPKGDGFVDYPVFERGYEALKMATTGFSQFDDLKRSTPLLKLVIWKENGILSEESFKEFSTKTQERVKALCDFKK